MPDAPAIAALDPSGLATARKAATAYHPIGILGDADLHLVNRFTGGWAPSLRSELAAAGGARQWFERQLSGTVPDTFHATSAKWWPSNTASTAALVTRDRAETERIWQAVANYERWVLVRRIHSERQVLECMTSFWEHHLHVPAEADAAQYFRASYGRMMRSLALTTFEKILFAAVTHPAMGCYLDNAQSTKDAPNENLGRELLELHTVGLAAGYTEADVKASARILTGYRVDTWETWKVAYDRRSHYVGRVSVLGFTHGNTSADGRAVAKAYLKYLAHHPSTAQRIARKLAVRFVADDPPQSLVDSLADVYSRSGTAIVPVLRALVASPEFVAAAGTKVRTPEEDVVATYRALGVRISAPRSGDSAANAILWATSDLGMRPFGWPRPDGRPDTAGAWTSVSRMLASFGVHQDLAGTWWPTEAVTYAEPKAWLPAPRVQFDELVDHISRAVLGRAGSPLLIRACAQVTGCAPADSITAAHELIQWKMPRLLATVLDTPTHMTR